MAKVELTAKQYADLRKINVSHVQRYCKESRYLAGVKQVKRFGRSFVLVMKSNYLDEINEL